MTKQKNRNFPLLSAYGMIIIKACIFSYILMHFFLMPVYVEGHSMEPCIEDGTMGISNIALRHVNGVSRFDVVLVSYEDEIWIKRIIALPKETVAVRNHVLYINDKAIEEPFLSQETRTEDFGPIYVLEDQVFVMGDNRAISYDSRMIGTIPLSQIISKDLYQLP